MITQQARVTDPLMAQFCSLGILHASRPTAICSDVMAVCSVQIEITESGDRLTTSTATVVEPMLIY